MSAKILYDYSKSNKAQKRKEKAIREYRKARPKEYLVYMGLAIFGLVTYMLGRISGDISGGSYHIHDIIIVILCLVLGLLTPYITRDRGMLQPILKYNLLDVIVKEDGIIMPDWDTIKPETTKFYPWKYIERIYWNPGKDYILIIKSNEGINVSKGVRFFKKEVKHKHEMMWKTIIDDEEEFKEALRKTGKLIENETMTITDWLVHEKESAKQKAVSKREVK